MTTAGPADPRTIVAATLREVAQWYPDARTDVEFEAVAADVERDDGDAACPLCQSRPCDTACPLEPFRPDYPATPG